MARNTTTTPAAKAAATTTPAKAGMGNSAPLAGPVVPTNLAGVVATTAPAPKAAPAKAAPKATTTKATPAPKATPAAPAKAAPAASAGAKAAAALAWLAAHPGAHAVKVIETGIGYKFKTLAGVLARLAAQQAAPVGTPGHAPTGVYRAQATVAGSTRQYQGFAYKPQATTARKAAPRKATGSK